MPINDRQVDRASRAARADRGRVGSDLRLNRASAGLSQGDVGRLVGLSASQVSRIERGLAPSASVEQLARIGAVVGLDVRVRAYPAGDAVRDAGHIRVTERLRGRLHASVTVRLEVPLPIVGDRRAWDVWLGKLVDTDGVHRELPGEIETRIVDTQALVRKMTLKMRDAGVEVVLLVVADTPSNRHAVAAAWPSMAAMFPISTRMALGALAEGRYPGGSSLVFL
jgi:transcriptional regulator with XRE-family HTH domain